MRLLQYFPKHRRVSGAISILLTILLLPLYTALSIIIESARLQSARQQLDELTYLGQVAVLADYMDFLYTNYDIYAFYSAEGADGAQQVKESFDYYVKNAQTSGGIDTRKLNKLFNIPLDSCTIEGMYSVADPEVLEYQIKQSGKYMMPADILSDFSFELLFKSLNESLGGLSKKLSYANAAAEQFKNSTEILTNGQDVSKKVKDLKKKIGEYETKYDDFRTKKSQVTNWYISNSDYDLINGYTESDRNNDNNNKNNAFIPLRDVMNNYRSNVDSYFSETDTSKRGDIKVTINGSDEGYLGLSGEVTVDDLLSKIGDKCSDCSGKGAFPSGYDLSSLSGYDSAKGALDTKIGDITYKVQKYDENKKMLDAVNAYNDLVGYGRGTLYNAYNDYITSLKKVQDSLSAVVDGQYAMAAAKEKIDIANLNTSTKDAATTNNKLTAAQLTHESAEEIQKLKDEKKANDADRAAAYKQAKADKNYMKLGSNVAEKFAAEVSKEEMDQWLTNYMNSPCYDATSADTSNYTAYSAGLNTVKDYDGKRNQIEEMSMTSVSTSSLSEDEVNAMNDKLDKLMQNAKDEKDSDEDEYLSSAEMDKLYSGLLGGSDDHLSDEWFPTESGKSYYLTTTQVLILLSFLGTTAVVEKESDKGFLDLIKVILDAFKNLSPADAALDSHVYDYDTLDLLGDADITVPSHGFEHGEASFHTNAEQKNKALEYAQGQVGANGSTLALDNGGNYYVDSTQVDAPTNFFNGRQPGKSIENLVGGASKCFGAIETFVKSLLTLNLLRILIALVDFCVGIVQLLAGIIELVIDLVTIISNWKNCISYILDQIYITYYIDNHFRSRQSSTTKFKYDFNPGCHVEGGSTCQKAVTFRSAQIEYLLSGTNCEIKNQMDSYYAILALRFALNYSMVSKNAAVISLQGLIPPAAAFIPAIVDYFDSKVDLMFMMMGYKVPLFKDNVMLVTLKDTFTDETKRNELKGMIESSLKDPLSGNTANSRSKNNRFKIKEWKTESDGTTYPVYEDSPELPDDKFTSMLESGAGGISKKTKPVKFKGGFKVCLDYELTLEALLFLYPEDEKVARMANLIEMEGKHNVDTGTGKASNSFNYDSGFRLKNCYTYVGSDINATYSPMMPMFAEGPAFDKAKLRNVQMNGY